MANQFIKGLLIFSVAVIVFAQNAVFSETEVSESWFMQIIKKANNKGPAKGSTVNEVSVSIPSKDAIRSNSPHFDIFMLGKSINGIKNAYKKRVEDFFPFELVFMNTPEALYQFQTIFLENGLQVLEVRHYNRYINIPKTQLHIPTAYYLMDPKDRCIGYIIMDTQWFDNQSNLVKTIKTMEKNSIGLKAVLNIPSDKSIDFYRKTRADDYMEAFAFMTTHKPESVFKYNTLSSEVMVLQAYIPNSLFEELKPYMIKVLNQHLERYASWL